MISIREQVFETNSSSCHSITICSNELQQKLLNYEALYTGTFEYDDDYGTYVNVLEENEIITMEEIVEKLKQFQERTLAEDTRLFDIQKFLKDHQEIYDMDLKTFVEAVFDDEKNPHFFNYESLLEALEIYTFTADRIFDVKDGDVKDLYSNVYLDRNTKKPVHVHVSTICC